MTLPPLGRIRPFVRRLNHAPDPTALFQAGGTGPNRFLLESSDRTPEGTERSVIGIRSALYLMTQGRTTTVTALTANGEAALDWLTSQVPGTERRASSLSVHHHPWNSGFDEGDRFRQPSPLDLVRQLTFGPTLTVQPNPWCHLGAGLLGYDIVDFFERLPPGPPESGDQPVAEWWIPDVTVVVDHRERTSTIVATAWGGTGVRTRQSEAAEQLAILVPLVAKTPPRRPSSEPEPIGLGEVSVDQSDGEFAATVERLQDHLNAGNIYQVVPSRTFSTPCAEPLEAYRQLRRRNPSPYLFFLEGPTRTVLGASPETCLRVDGLTGQATLVPIAGTVPRGVDRVGDADPDADTRYEVSLRHNVKEHAEHTMLVDLARNDIARLSVPGSRRLTRLLAVERYAHLMHLVSEVTGTLRPGVDALEALATTMPMGTLVGAPKVRAAELLRAAEPRRRAVYGGAVGYLRLDGTLDTAILIRSAVVIGGIASVAAGAGVVLDSVPMEEARETSRKARVVLEAIAAANRTAEPEVVDA